MLRIPRWLKSNAVLDDTAVFTSKVDRRQHKLHTNIYTSRERESKREREGGREGGRKEGRKEGRMGLYVHRKH